MAEKQGNCNVIGQKAATTWGGLTTIITSAQTCSRTKQTFQSIHVTQDINKTFCWTVSHMYFSPCFLLLNYTFHLHSCCRLSYQRPSMWTAMSWLFLTTCSYITIPSMGEGLADSTLQKVRLLIWRMVGTFFTSYNLLRSFSFIVSFKQPPISPPNHTPSCF